MPGLFWLFNIFVAHSKDSDFYSMIYKNLDTISCIQPRILIMFKFKSQMTGYLSMTSRLHNLPLMTTCTTCTTCTSITGKQQYLCNWTRHN
jgi:hypothetical protein